VIETSRPLPTVNVAGRYKIDTRLMVRVRSSQSRSLPWISATAPPLAWPVYPLSDQPPSVPGRTDVSRGGRGPTAWSSEKAFCDLFSEQDLKRIEQTTFGRLASELPAGKVQVAAAILADVYPIDYQPRPIPERFQGGAVNASNRDLYDAAREWDQIDNSLVASRMPESMKSTKGQRGGRARSTIDDDCYYWMTKGLGNIWLTHLQGADEESKPPRPHLISPIWLSFDAPAISLASGQATRLRLVVPDDLESRIQELVDSTSDADEFAKVVMENSVALSEKIRTEEIKSWITGATGGTEAAMPTRAAPPTSPFFRQLSITVVGTEPLKADENAVGAAKSSP
jgi:hypothetical protein